MKNIDRLAKFVTKNGANGIMIHTVAGTTNWIVAQKILTDKWLITLLNPMGNITYNLGTVTDDQHIHLWHELTKTEIENKFVQIAMRKELKGKIDNFIKKYEKTYKKFIKIEKKKKIKNGIQNRNKHKQSRNKNKNRSN